MLYRRRKRRRREVRDRPGPTATMWLTKRFVAAFSDLKVTRSPRQVRHELVSVADDMSGLGSARSVR
jgi:hypothetical protein